MTENEILWATFLSQTAYGTNLNHFSVINPQSYRIGFQNNGHYDYVTQGHQFRYHSNARMRLPMCE